MVKPVILLAALAALVLVLPRADALAARDGLPGLANAGAFTVPFDAAKAPPAPDYARAEAWAARPERDDAADVHPPGTVAIDPRRAPVDVFFVHPTSFFSRDQWNAAIDDSKVNSQTDAGSIRNQASVFNGCCAIYAPRYRQTTFAGFTTRIGPDAEKSMALAYSDVRRAFDYFIEHDSKGRPFILASHSQGSRYALWLLQDAIEGTPLRNRFVAAYIVGYAIPADWFTRNLKTIKVCETAVQTGCVLTWSTYGEGADAKQAHFGVMHRYGDQFESNEGKALVCTNPLSWTSGSAPAPATLNRGAWAVPRRGEPGPPRPAATGARCENGVLFIDKTEGLAMRRGRLPGDNYHRLDYQLFYMNIRANASERIEAFQAQAR